MVFCGYLRANECCILFFNYLFEGILKFFISIWFISSKIYGIEDCHPHKFRHSMATHMIRNGADIKTVSEKLGHSTIAITLELYVHSDEETQKAANKKYSDILWS